METGKTWEVPSTKVARRPVLGIVLCNPHNLFAQWLVKNCLGVDA